MTASVLEASGVSMQFGGLKALNEVSFTLAEGEIIGLIGPNGAGKTTLFNCLTGMYAPTSGQVSRAGVQLRRSPNRAWRARSRTSGCSPA
jgi:branched-chain amino acid transport system ATP-binding protein